MKQIQLTENNGQWQYAHAPQYGVSAVNPANGVNGLGEPASAIVGASIAAVSAISGSIMSYNKGIEQERMAYNNEWSVKMEAAQAEREANVLKYEDGEMSLILKQYKGLQAGLSGVGGLGTAADIANILSSTLVTGASIFSTVTNNETQKNITNSNSSIANSYAQIEESKVRSLQLQQQILAAQGKNANSNPTANNNTGLYIAGGVGVLLLATVITVVVVKKNKKKSTDKK
jgi:hypothetical protein